MRENKKVVQNDGRYKTVVRAKTNESRRVPERTVRKIDTKGHTNDWPTHKHLLTDVHTNHDWLTYTQTMTDVHTNHDWLTYTQTLTDRPTHRQWLTDLHTNHDWPAHKPWLIYLHTNSDWLTYTQTMTAVKAHSQSQHDEEFASSVPGSFAYAGALSDADKEFWLIMKKDMPMDYHHSAQLEYILLAKQNLKQK